MTNRMKKSAITVIALAGPLLALLALLTLSGDTPDPLPSHWGMSGHPDATASLLSSTLGFVLTAAVVALVEVAIVWLARRPTWLLPAVLCYVSWLLSLCYIQVLVASHGATRASSVDLAWYSIVPVVLIPAALGFATWRLTPLDVFHPVRVGPTNLTLGKGERVAWTGFAHSIPMRWISGVGLAAAALLIFFVPVVALPLAVLAVLVAAVSSLGVRVDEAGLHTLWGPFGWPRTKVGLDDITSAHAEEIEPLKWGGWGYRIGRHGVAAVVRRGPGIVVERRGRPPYAVTVDGAPEAAGVLNALLARHVAESPHG